MFLQAINLCNSLLKSPILRCTCLIILSASDESILQPEDLAIELMNLSQQDHAQTVTTEFTHVIEQISIDVEDDSVTSCMPFLFILIIIDSFSHTSK